MLNLFTIKKNKKLTTKSFTKKTSKHFPSPLREWKNSIYVYNKNSLNLIPYTAVYIKTLIKNYFDLFNKNIEIKMRTKRLFLRLRRLSLNKYYISNGLFKHTNNKVLINLYVFNRQKTNYLSILKKGYLNSFLSKKSILRQNNINIKLINRLNLINNKGVKAIKMLNNDKYLLIKALNTVLKNKNYNLNNFRYLSKYTENFYKNLIKKSLKKIKIYFFYKQLLYINKSKLNYTYLQFLKKHLEKLYNKNVEFNIINIKRFYLNSDIISESISIKMAKSKKRIKKYLTDLKNKIPVIKKGFFDEFIIKPTNFTQDLSQNKLILQRYVINNLKYKHITGFRLEAKGRLNRRFTAERTSHMLRYKGNLLDIDSSYKGISSVLLKGNLKSNTQYTRLNFKSRTGSFGVKGWISGN